MASAITITLATTITTASGLTQVLAEPISIEPTESDSEDQLFQSIQHLSLTLVGYIVLFIGHMFHLIPTSHSISTKTPISITLTHIMLRRLMANIMKISCTLSWARSNKFRLNTSFQGLKDMF